MENSASITILIIIILLLLFFYKRINNACSQSSSRSEPMDQGTWDMGSRGISGEQSYNYMPR